MTVTLASENGEESGEYEFYNTKGRNYPAPFDGIWALRNYHADSGSDETVSWVKEQLRNCYSPAHADCLPATGATLPTRVLDLGAPDSSLNHLAGSTSSRESLPSTCASATAGVASTHSPQRSQLWKTTSKKFPGPSCQRHFKTSSPSRAGSGSSTCRLIPCA